MLKLAEQRFGRLLVIRVTDKRSNDGKVIWECLCKKEYGGCGKTTYVTGRNLKAGFTKSCGCLRRDKAIARNSQGEGIAARNRILFDYKKNAGLRGLGWKLADKDFYALTKGNCFYCGKLPTNVYKVCSCKSIYTYNGIDRLNNKTGYTKDNCVSCCTECNYAKKKKTLKEFIGWIKRVARRINQMEAPSQKP